MSAAPRTLAAATALAASFAEADGRLAAIEEKRKVKLGRINAAADAMAGPLIAELAGMAERLERWWGKGGAAIAGDAKSAQLGGCLIGTRSHAASLAHTFKDEKAAVAALRKTRLATRTVRVRYALDKVGTLKLVQSGGKTGEALIALGFSAEQGERFFVSRVEQPGAIGAA